MKNKCKLTKFSKLNMQKCILSLITILSISISSVSAQTSINSPQINNSFNGAAAFCPYTFTKNLSQGANEPDVKILQQILNADDRTVVARSGIASIGNETNNYGVATREAVKRFQALFIEYVGVANGVFGPKTRTVMNAVCNSERFVSGASGGVYTAVNTQNTVNNNSQSTSSIDRVSPSIFLRSNSTALNTDVAARIFVTASKPINAFTLESIIIQGGTVSDIRKLAPNSYSLLITPNENAKVVIAQVEADRVEDLNGNKNESASNEIRISVVQKIIVATTTATVQENVTSANPSSLDSIFNKILASVSQTPAVVAPSVNTANQNPYQNQNPYGNSNNSGNNAGNNQGNSLMNTLLLSSLLGRGNSGGGGLFGNNKTPQPQPTTGTPVECQLDKSLPQCKDAKQIAPETNPKPDTKSNPSVGGEGSGGKINKNQYLCVANKNPNTGAINENWKPGNKEGKYVVLDTTILKQGSGRSNKLALYATEAKENITAPACFIGGNIKALSQKIICCKAVRTVNGKKICEEHAEIKDKVIENYFDISANKPQFTPGNTCDGESGPEKKDTKSATSDESSASPQEQIPQTPEQPKTPSSASATPEPKTTQQIPTEPDGTCQLGYKVIGNFSKYCEKIDGPQDSIPASITNTCPSEYTRFKDNFGNFNCRIKYVTGGGI